MRSKHISAILPVLTLGIAAGARGQHEFAHVEGGAGALTGSGIVGIGDINIDGFDDYAYSWESGLGDAMLMRSGRNGNHLSSSALSTVGQFYRAGDITGDGFPDVIAGDPTLGRVTVYAPRRAYVNDHANFTYKTLVGSAAEAFGASAASVGDLNNDGYDDFVVGAPKAFANGKAEAGKVFLFSGKDGFNIFTWSGIEPLGWFGQSVSSAGDVNKDGFEDILIGNPNYPFGKIFVYSGKTKLLLGSVQPGLTDRFGWSVRGGYDFNGDTYPDFVVGTPWSDVGATRGGAVRIVSGKTFTIINAWFGSVANGEAGSAVDAIHDITGDGVPEVLIGTPGAQPNALVKGLVQLRSGVTFGVLHEVYGPNKPGSTFGHQLCTVGDLNKDDSDDFLFASTHGAGEVWIHSGRAYPSSAVTYGNAQWGTLGAPSLFAISKPSVAASWNLLIGNSRGAPTIGLLLLGAQAVSQPTNLGGTLLVQPTLYKMLELPTGGLNETIDLDDWSLTGAEFYLQVLMVDPGAAKGVSFSRGLHVTLGL